jgi:hypothetical protein
MFDLTRNEISNISNASSKDELKQACLEVLAKWREGDDDDWVKKTTFSTSEVSNEEMIDELKYVFRDYAKPGIITDYELEQLSKDILESHRAQKNKIYEQNLDDIFFSKIKKGYDNKVDILKDLISERFYNFLSLKDKADLKIIVDDIVKEVEQKYTGQSKSLNKALKKILPQALDVLEESISSDLKLVVNDVVDDVVKYEAEEIIRKDKAEKMSVFFNLKDKDQLKNFIKDLVKNVLEANPHLDVGIKKPIKKELLKSIEILGFKIDERNLDTVIREAVMEESKERLKNNLTSKDKAETPSESDRKQISKTEPGHVLASSQSDYNKNQTAEKVEPEYVRPGPTPPKPAGNQSGRVR